MVDRLDLQLVSAALRRVGWIRFWTQLALGVVVVGVFHPASIQRRWLDLQAGGDSHELALWSILMFQAWKAQWASAISE